MVFVFDFRFGERGFVVHAPVDGAQAFVDEVVFVEREKCFQHHRLVLRIHGDVGIVEASEDADAFELLALQVEIFLRVLATFRAHVVRPHLELLAAEFLVDFDFDGQSMTVPSRHVRRVHAGHGFGLHDEVLQTLVHGRAEVDGAARIGRAVVQQVNRRSLASRAHTLVEGHLFPASQHLRLIDRKIRLHREGGFRQVKSGFKLRWHSLGSPK